MAKILIDNNKSLHFSLSSSIYFEHEEDRLKIGVGNNYSE